MRRAGKFRILAILLCAGSSELQAHLLGMGEGDRERRGGRLCCLSVRQMGQQQEWGSKQKAQAGRHEMQALLNMGDWQGRGAQRLTGSPSLPPKDPYIEGRTLGKPQVLWEDCRITVIRHEGPRAVVGTGQSYNSFNSTNTQNNHQSWAGPWAQQCIKMTRVDPGLSEA